MSLTLRKAPAVEPNHSHITSTLQADLELLGVQERSPEEQEQALIQVALQNVQRDPAYGRVAADTFIRGLYRDILGTPDPDADTYRRGFAAYLRRSIDAGALDPRLETLDWDALAARLAPERDSLLEFIGLATLTDRYLVRDPRSRQLLELPQYLFMRVAAGLALLDDEPVRRAVDFYDQISQLNYLPSTPTLFNAGTPHHQLSACYLADVEDSMDGILGAASDFGQLAKYAGGIGTSITRLRSAGSPIAGINGISSGIVPFAHLYDALIKGISQGGRRRGTMALYLEPWHLEIEAFLDLKKNSGDPYLRTHSLNTALWIPDEFLRRVEEDEDWYLFDPQVAPDLPDVSGAAFHERYAGYIRQAERGEIPERAFRVTRARGLFSKILATLQETSHPWLVFKDVGNVRSMLPGVIHSSNLCTEIFLPTSTEEIAVCNLASVNLARHLSENGIDWEKLRETVRVAVRGLDNVIDINFYPTEKARRSNVKNRPVGLGLMGMAEVFARMGLAYGEAASLDLVDEAVEFISYAAIEASHELAAERGSFPAFAESRWAAGQVPIDTLGALERERRQPVEINREQRRDWTSLRQRVAAGMRNGTVLAIAPTATISLIAGTSPSLDPYYANVFARQTLSGKFMEVNPVLVEELRDLGIWEQVSDRLVAERGELSMIPEIPEDIKRRYPTAYQVDPRRYIDVAARAQKWVDMGISRNLYIQARDLETMTATYLHAWRAGLKSTYYLFMAPRMFAEQSSVRVNKARQRPRWNLDDDLSDGAEDEYAFDCASCQ